MFYQLCYKIELLNKTKIINCTSIQLVINLHMVHLLETEIFAL